MLESGSTMSARVLRSALLLQSVVSTAWVRAERSEQWARTAESGLRESKRREADLRTDLDQVSRALEQEKMWRTSITGPGTELDLATLPYDSLLERCFVTHRALELERARVEELDDKWQRSHRDLVTARLAVRKLGELQKVHMEVQEKLQRRQHDIDRVHALKRTIVSQEGVIGKLEDVVQGLVTDNKALKQAENSRRRELDLLSDQLRRSLGTAADMEMYTKMQERHKETWAELEEVRQTLATTRESLREEQSRRAQAETTVEALRQELHEHTKRSGLELARWRAKYVEATAAGAVAATASVQVPSGPPLRGGGRPESTSGSMRPILEHGGPRPGAWPPGGGGRGGGRMNAPPRGIGMAVNMPIPNSGVGGGPRGEAQFLPPAAGARPLPRGPPSVPPSASTTSRLAHTQGGPLQKPEPFPSKVPSRPPQGPGHGPIPPGTPVQRHQPKA